MAITVLDESELEDLIHKVVKLAVAELRDELERSRTPEIMDKDRLAEYLTCDISSINRFMKNGMPSEKCGDRPRFRKCCIDAWLKGFTCSQCPFINDSKESGLSPARKTTTVERGSSGSVSAAG